MPRLALGISYDGRPWQGWQKQPNGQTVQDALERALATFATVPVQTTCAGRTDTHTKQDPDNADEHQRGDLRRSGATKSA